jgi:hypothetical protein
MGSFGLMPLQELVDFLSRRKATATLTCERGAVRKSCQLVEGAAVEAASNDPREYLGQLLLNFGHIGEDDLARAFATQEQTNVRLGQVLVSLGLVTPELVRETLAIKIRETLLDAYLWESGFFTVEEGPPRPRDALDASVPLEDIAREAEFRAAAWQAFRSAFPGGATTLEVIEAKVPPGLDPVSVNGRIVALAREGRSIDELAQALRATDFQLYQRLYALANQGVLRAAPERPAAQGDVALPAVLLGDAQAHLAAGRLLEAEEAAARALSVDPGLAAAAALRDQARERLARTLRAAFLEPPRTPSLRVARHEVARLPVGAADKWLLARCDGTRDAATLVRLSPAGELDVLKGLKRLVEQRLLAVR